MKFDTPSNWTDEQNALFSRLFLHTRESQLALTRRGAERVPFRDWEALCWNIAWVAVVMSGSEGPLIHVDDDGRLLALEVRGSGLPN